MSEAVIGYYDDSTGRGGTTRYLIELLAGLNRRQWRPVFFAPIPYPWHDDLHNIDVEIVRPPVGFPASPAKERDQSNAFLDSFLKPRLPEGALWSAGLVRDIRQLVRLFGLRHVDLLHTNNTGAEPSPIAARLAGIPRVLGTWHVDSSYDLAGARQGRRYRMLERASMRSLHHAIAVSEATKADWLRRCRLSAKYQQRVTVVHNGIDVDRVERRQSRSDARRSMGLPDNVLLIGSLGRLDAAKGYEFLLKALPQVITECPSVHLALAGRGPLEVELRLLAQNLGVYSHVHFLGFVDDVRTVLECLDVYVQPSLCEAHPISILEAGGIGLPVVASAVGGIPETVIHGETGLVVPPRDAEALALGLLTLVNSPNCRRTMSERAKEHIRRFYTRDIMVAKTMDIYERLRRSGGADTRFSETE